MKYFWNTHEGRRILYGAAIVVVIIAARVVFLEQKKTEQVPVEQAPRAVQVARVLDISQDRLPLPAVGRVVSQSEVVLRSEAAGEVVRVTKSFGDFVRAGEIVAEVNNASQRAEVLRAQGVLQGAQANVLKLQGGSRESETLIREAVRTAYTVADDAVRNKADQLIDNPETSPRITIASSNYFIRQDAERTRESLTVLFREWSSSIQTMPHDANTDMLVAHVLTAQANLETVRSFLDDMAIVTASLESHGALSQGTIDKWRSDISMARSNVNATLNTLISSYNSLRSQIGADTGRGEDVLLAQAQVTQAEAGVLSAQAALEKTIVRSPISGEINQISISRGDFVSSFEEVAKVANNNALEIITFVSEEERKVVSVGTTVRIDRQYDGVITRIAPAIDQATGKIEVAVGVDGVTTLINGQSVSLDIERTLQTVASTDVITVPITSLKLTAEGAFVFTVTDNNAVVAHQVEIGSIIGEKIIVTDGLTLDMNIVLDARGLQDGQVVSIR